MNNVLLRLLRWLPALIWMTVIYMLSAQTGDELSSWMPLFERWIPWMKSFDWGHFAAYFILALTLLWGFGKINFGIKLIVIVLCFLYGVADEFHQSFVDGRFPDPKDVRNDTIGALTAMIFISIPPVRKWFVRYVLKT